MQGPSYQAPDQHSSVTAQVSLAQTLHGSLTGLFVISAGVRELLSPAANRVVKETKHAWVHTGSARGC